MILSCGRTSQVKALIPLEHTMLSTNTTVTFHKNPYKLPRIPFVCIKHLLLETIDVQLVVIGYEILKPQVYIPKRRTLIQELPADYASNKN